MWLVVLIGHPRHKGSLNCPSYPHSSNKLFQEHGKVLLEDEEHFKDVSAVACIDELCVKL